MCKSVPVTVLCPEYDGTLAQHINPGIMFVGMFFSSTDLKNVEKGPSSALLSALDIVAIAGHYSFLFKASREEAAGQGCWPEASGSEGLVEGRSARQGETMFSTLPQVRRVGQRMATLSV